MAENINQIKWEAVSEDNPFGASFSSEGVSKSRLDELGKQLDLSRAAADKVLAEKETPIKTPE